MSYFAHSPTFFSGRRCSQGYKAALWEILNNFFFCLLTLKDRDDKLHVSFCHCLNVAHLNRIIIQSVSCSWLLFRPLKDQAGVKVVIS